MRMRDAGAVVTTYEAILYEMPHGFEGRGI